MFRGVLRRLEMPERPDSPGQVGDHCCWRGWGSLRLRRRPNNPFARLSKTLSAGCQTTITPESGQENFGGPGNIPDQELEGSRKGFGKGCHHSADRLWKGFTKTITR